MSGGYGLGAGAIPQTVTSWKQLEELMGTTQRALAGESGDGFAPSVRGAASTFLAAWAGYAGESQTLAQGFVSALDSTQALYQGTDTLTAEQLEHLDGRLGPAR